MRATVRYGAGDVCIENVPGEGLGESTSTALGIARAGSGVESAR